MIALESITLGLSLTGLDPTGIETAVAGMPFADDAVQVIDRTSEGGIKERLLYGLAPEATGEYVAHMTA